MNILRLAIELFALYILYKLVFDFIIPIIQTSKDVKKQFGNMNDSMHSADSFRERNQFDQNRKDKMSPNSSAPRSKSDDYIEFEEMK